MSNQYAYCVFSTHEVCAETPHVRAALHFKITQFSLALKIRQFVSSAIHGLGNLFLYCKDSSHLTTNFS